MFFYCSFSFARSNEYYQTVVTHMLTQCNTDCKRSIFEQEINSAFINLLEAVLRQLQWELSELKKEKSQ